MFCLFFSHLVIVECDNFAADRFTELSGSVNSLWMVSAKGAVMNLLV